MTTNLAALPKDASSAGASPSKSPVPGPRGLPLVGNAFAIARDPIGYFTEMAARYGDIARVEVGRTPLYLLSHPDLVQEVLVGRHKDSVKDELLRGLKVVVGEGLLTSEGEKWRRQRKLAAPSFSRKEIGVYADTMVEVAGRFADELQSGQVRDVHADMTRVTLEVVVKTLFDCDQVPRVDEVGPTIAELLESYRAAATGWQRFLPEWLPTPARARIRHSVATIDEILFEIVDAQRATDRRGSDLLSRLLDAADEDGEAMSDQQLRDEIVTLFLAGHETTAIALTSALYLLARHPEVRARLEAEVDEVLGDRPARLEDVRNLRIVDAVVRETMRLYPPAWMIGREATRDLKVGGAHIPAGAQLLMSQWIIHRDPRWFDQPQAFRPERWLEGEAQEIPRYAYFPFGGGPRVCIGNHFATMEAVLVLATLAQSARLESAPGAPFELQPAVTLRPTHPVEMTAIRR